MGCVVATRTRRTSSVPPVGLAGMGFGSVRAIVGSIALVGLEKVLSGKFRPIPRQRNVGSVDNTRAGRRTEILESPTRRAE